jgi:hypothetical protein
LDRISRDNCKIMPPGLVAPRTINRTIRSQAFPAKCDETIQNPHN